jgi:hypothetical protein
MKTKEEETQETQPPLLENRSEQIRVAQLKLNLLRSHMPISREYNLL